MGKHRSSGARAYGDGLGVGYKNPPGRKWSPGESGNPSGRAKGPKAGSADDLRARFREFLATSVPMAGPNGPVEMPVSEALVRRTLTHAVNDAKLAVKILPWLVSFIDGETEAEASDLGPEGEAVLAELGRRLERPGETEAGDE